jgi:hypothetical protein
VGDWYHLELVAVDHTLDAMTRFRQKLSLFFAAMLIPDSSNCIASINLGEGKRAMLRYVTGRNPEGSKYRHRQGVRPYWYSEKQHSGNPDIDPALWRGLWRGLRYGVTNERFWLF